MPQCGYCQSGMLCQATMMLMQNNTGGGAASMPNLCVCGTYQRVSKALGTAAQLNGKV